MLNKMKIEEIEKIDFNYGKMLHTQFKKFNTPDELKSIFFGNLPADQLQIHKRNDLLGHLRVNQKQLILIYLQIDVFKRSNNAIKNLTNERLMIWLIKSFIPENSIALAEFNFRIFSKFDGDTLIRKSAEEFQNIDPKYGRLLYDKLNELNSYCDETIRR